MSQRPNQIPTQQARLAAPSARPCVSVPPGAHGRAAVGPLSPRMGEGNGVKPACSRCGYPGHNSRNRACAAAPVLCEGLVGTLTLAGVQTVFERLRVDEPARLEAEAGLLRVRVQEMRDRHARSAA